ncbi:Hypothetical predicted protein [Mytilus galloprovincialis]|uniref:Cadherin domain-containing protein n=1 Tax=Mytilus galloprovincialis TaxID=29158 RepID=A0A8B6G2X5_MYTGA|nr:Hypothetical predicted protein [Mytilus galloprovincialis]
MASYADATKTDPKTIDSSTMSGDLSSQSIQQPRWNDDIKGLHEIQENLPLGSKLATISAEGHNGVAVTLVTYGTVTERRVFLNYTTNGIKAVGTIYLKEEIDREVREERLTINISDVNDNAPKFSEPFYQQEVPEDGGGLQGNATLIIRIQDIQIKPPYFTGQPFNAEIPEESPVGTTVKFVYPIRADDGDTGVPHAIEYNFTEGVCKEFFEIKSNSRYGIVTVKKRIDRDHGVIHNVRGVCTLTLMALEKVNSGESNPGPSNSTTPVDVNSRLHLELRYHNGSRVQGIKPVPDTVQGSGNIKLYLQDDFSFDFEKVQEVSFMLVAREEKAQPYNTQCIVHLKIIDRNDNFPQFTKSSFAVHIVENYTNEQLVLSEKVSDFKLYERFLVNNLTGVLTKRKNVILDYEKIDEYVLILLAKDGGGNLQSAEVVVTLDDINNNPPVFLQSFYNGVIKETNKNFKITVNAFDRDQRNTSNSRVEFVLIDSPFNMQNNFTITTTWQNGEYLGKISLKESLDYEKLNKTTIELYIKAKDFGSPSLSSTTTVTLDIQSSENPKHHCMCGSALTSLLAATMTPTCNTTRYPPGNEIAETETFMFRYEPNSHVMVAITHHKCYVYRMSDTETVKAMHILKFGLLLSCLVMSASGCDEWAKQNPCMCTCDDDNNECADRCKVIAAEDEKLRCSEQCFMIAKDCWSSCASEMKSDL